MLGEGECFSGMLGSEKHENGKLGEGENNTQSEEMGRKGMR